MKIVSSVTVWQDAIGERMSITYSELNEQGQLIADNKRVDKVVLEDEAMSHISALKEYAQEFVNTL